MVKGNKLVVSYDGKAERIWVYFFNSTPEIKIINGIELYDRTPERMVPTSIENYKYIVSQIVESAGEFDWVIHDGLDTLAELVEMGMRAEFKLKPFQGFAEKSYWKYRRVLLSNMHRKSIESARKGVIYNTYLTQIDEEIIDGEVVRRKTVPRWFDVVETETDVLFKTDIRKIKDETRFFVNVVTSKIPKWLTGAELDVTMKVPQAVEEKEG